MSLKLLNLDGVQILQRSQLKDIFGGEDPYLGGPGGGSMCPPDACSSSGECDAPYDGCFDYYCSGNSGPTFKQCGYDQFN